MLRWHAKGDDKKQAAAARAISMSADDPALTMHDMQASKVIFMMDNTTRVLWPQDELLAALHAGTGYFHTVRTKYHKRRPKRQAQPATEGRMSSRGRPTIEASPTQATKTFTRTTGIPAGWRSA
jgi:hypothetical protein